MTIMAPRAEAITDPIAGAVSSPVDVPAPFPVGVKIKILAGYGPSAGSSLHSNTNDSTHGNDYYALDLVYEGEENSGKGLPVVASFEGEVVKAGWATEGWANFGQRVILRHDLGDGNVYYTLYAHLNAIDLAVEEGTTVTGGQVLGELGQSCQGELSCSSFSTPHLHWSMHSNSMIGGTGTGGSYGGNAVVPEKLSGYENLVQGLVLELGEPVCGDDICFGETHETCPADCPVCEAISPGGRTIEENDICFVRSGSPQYWYPADVGSEGALLWTNATDSAQADDSGLWNLEFEQEGSALLEAWVEPRFATSEQARYVITHGDMVSEVVIDQSMTTGWMELGTFDFAAGGGQSVRLDDNTGEAFSLDRVLVFDAIRITPSATGDAADNPGFGTVGSERGGDQEGCACSATPRRFGTSAWWLMLLVGGLLGRRRRRWTGHARGTTGAPCSLGYLPSETVTTDDSRGGALSD